MGLLGVISGKTIMERNNLMADSEIMSVENKYGRASVLITNKIALIIRHGIDSKNYILPHAINHCANLQALKDLGVREVVAINSTGSLKKDLPPGMIVIPDDFIQLTAAPTIHENIAVHITPEINDNVRQKLICTARKCNIPAIEKGTYWQVPGPRLETKAEIKMMSNFADIVGMTMASEATIALELCIPYASVCSVDNFGNGITEKPLSMEDITAGIRRNSDLMIHLISSYIELYSSSS